MVSALYIYIRISIYVKCGSVHEKMYSYLEVGTSTSKTFYRNLVQSAGYFHFWNLPLRHQKRFIANWQNLVDISDLFTFQLKITQ